MANEQTRNLLPYAITRTTMKLITFMFSEKVFQDDGSFQLVENPRDIKARIISLTSSELQRLRESGITINSGISVAINEELTQVPDYLILPGSEFFRVISFTFEEGVSVMTCDELPGVEES